MRHPSTGKKILIVDDEISLVEFLESLLTSRGHKVAVAHNGEDGLKKISQGDPDLLILDVTMPKMGGVQLYSKICSRYGRSRFPVIVLTALEGITDFFEGALVDRVMTKPFKVKELLDSIDQLLAGTGRQLIWLVDESEVEAERISGVLASERFAVQHSRTLAQALSGLSVPPQCILMECADAPAVDVAMQALRSIEEMKRTPLVVYSQYPSAAIEERARAAGADAYVGKIEDLKPVFAAMRRLQKKGSTPDHVA